MTDKNHSWLEQAEQRALFAERMAEAAAASGLSRRQFLLALGLGGSSVLLAACGAAPDAGAGPTAAPAPGNATAVTAAPAATAAPGAGGDAAPDDRQVFRFAINADPASHDFNKDLYNGGEATLFAGLTRLDENYQAQPYAAESWTVSDDGTVYTFKINRKGTWTNGDPVTAHDFVYSFTRQLNPETGASYAAILYDIVGAQEWNTGAAGAGPDKLGIKAIDDYTLEITLKGPREYFPLLVGYASALPAHKASVERYGDKWTEAGNIVSNGPFKLKRWDRGRELEYERNEEFAVGPKPRLKTVIASVIPDNAGLLPYESGQIDARAANGIPASEVPRLQADPELSKQLIRISSPSIAFLSPEANKPPFDQLGVRQALQHAIDRETILKVINNLGVPAYSLISPDQPYTIDPNAYPEFPQAYAYDPERARSKLAGTPYEGGKNWPEVTLTSRPVGPNARLVAEVIQQQLAQNLGLTIKLENPEDGKVFISNLFGGKYQFVFYIWFTDYPDPSNHYTAIWYGKAARRRFAWKSATFDQLVSAAAGEIDKTKRADLYLQAERVMRDEAAYIPLYYPTPVNVYKPYVKGIPQNKSGVYVTDNSVYRSTKFNIYISNEKQA